MPLQFDLDIKNDPFFLEGKEEGKEEGIEIGMAKKDDEKNHAFVSSLFQNTDFSDEKIATIANVPLAFVVEVKKSLEKPKS